VTIVFFLIAAIFFTLAVLLLLRSGRLREKYAVLWLIIGGLTIVLGIFPELLEWAAAVLHVRVPANLLFALAILLLVGVSLHASRELTVLEDETRALAEEVAILRQAVEEIQDEGIANSDRNTVPQRDGHTDVRESERKDS